MGQPAMFIIGVDPSTKAMGYGVLKAEGRGQLEYVTAGVITAPAGWSIERRLDELGRGLEEVVSEIDLSEVVLCGIEAGFGGYKKGGVMGALATGAARGVAIYVLHRRFKAEVRQYQPSTVKKAATGLGDAQKGDVGMFVARQLGLRNVPDGDTGDAIAVAITRAHDSDLFVGR